MPVRLYFNTSMHLSAIKSFCIVLFETFVVAFVVIFKVAVAFISSVHTSFSQSLSHDLLSSHLWPSSPHTIKLSFSHFREFTLHIGADLHRLSFSLQPWMHLSGGCHEQLAS